MKQVTATLASIAALIVLAFAPLPAYAASTSGVFTESCSGANSSNAICKGSDGAGVFTAIKSIIQVLLVVSGIIAVIMIIVGGIRYTTSNGDQAHVKAAKDTILYSVIGLIVSIGAFAIVTWVIGQL